MEPLLRHGAAPIVIAHVSEFASDQVARLDAGSWFGAEFSGTRIRRLSDLLAGVTGSRRLMLEVKGDYTMPQVRSVVGQIEAAAATERVFLQSFGVPILRMVRTILPDEPLGLLVDHIGDDPVAD